jgi:hypothetical protein
MDRRSVAESTTARALALFPLNGGVPPGKTAPRVAKQLHMLVPVQRHVGRVSDAVLVHVSKAQAPDNPPFAGNANMRNHAIDHNRRLDGRRNAPALGESYHAVEDRNVSANHEFAIPETLSWESTAVGEDLPNHQTVVRCRACRHRK